MNTLILNSLLFQPQYPEVITSNAKPRNDESNSNKEQL